MKDSEYKKMTAAELVQKFAAIAAVQNDALLGEDQAEVNRLFWHLMAIQEELKARAGDQRTALMPLYESPNMQVRLKAAKATLAVAPTAAREQLKAIEASHVQPQAGEAGMSLWNLDRGVFNPT
jgi:cytochrome c oxidase assembly protein Cox11